MMVPPALRATIVASAIALGGTQDARSQESRQVHPTKTVFADADNWPAVAPGDVPLRNFEPFRAVYARVYRDQQGHGRDDRVIITAERIAWGETGAILVTLVDAGNRDYDDTSARVQTRMFAEGDQRLLMQIAPAPGTARDYMVIHADHGPIRATLVNAITGEGTKQTVPVPTPQLGAPAFWIVGSMPLRSEQRIRFSAADAPAPSSILGARPFHVTGRETIATVDGERSAWVVTYPLGMTDARAMRTFIIDRPPYLLGKQPIDLETGDLPEIGTLRLIEFATFGGR